MKGPSLQKSAVISAALHLTVLIVTVLVMRHTAGNILPSPYEVSLVGPGRERGGARTSAVQPAVERGAATTSQSRERAVRGTTLDDHKGAGDQDRVEDRIHELRAKRKLNDIAALRQKVLDVRGAPGPASSGRQKGSASGTPGGSGVDTYTARITEEIHEQWGWPGDRQKDLETVVAVRIEKDGTIIIRGLEKRSGNRFFDSLALNALRKASPVTPPPQEMEIGIRFYP